MATPATTPTDPHRPAMDTSTPTPPVSSQHPPTEADIAARQQLVALRVARQVDLVGYLFFSVGALSALSLVLAVFGVTELWFGLPVLLLPLGAGLLARGRVAANLTFVVGLSGLAGAITYAFLGQPEGAPIPLEDGLADRLVHTALLAVLPLWILRTLMRGVRVRLFDARPLRMPTVPGESDSA